MTSQDTDHARTTASVFLAGGGTPRQEAEVWREAFAGVGTVLYWPIALARSQRSSAEAWFHDSLRELGVDVHVDTWFDLVGRRPADLDDHELLFVGGGRTSRLATHVQEHLFAEPVRAWVRSGGRYYGGSAGAILACETVSIAALVDDDPAARGIQGLGLVPGWSVLPHADTGDPKAPATVHRLLGCDLIVLPEASGVAVNGDAMRAIGPDQPEVYLRSGERHRL